MISVRPSIAVAVAAGLLTASACGSSGDSTTAAGATASTAATAATGADQHGAADGPSVATSIAPSASDSANNGGSSPTNVPAGSSTSTHVYVPPAGRYVYDTSGFSESGSGPTSRRSEPPPESVDEVSVTKRGSVTEVRTSSSYGSSGQQTSVVVTGPSAHLARLTFWFADAGVTSEQSVTPQPEILVARIPYVVGDRWESAWRDPSVGMQGVGWGAVVRHETLTVSRGSVDTVVLQLHQRFEGSLSGELDIMSWVDPATGIVVRQVLTTDLRDATGASHSEITRVLRAS